MAEKDSAAYKLNTHRTFRLTCKCTSKVHMYS